MSESTEGTLSLRNRPERATQPDKPPTADAQREGPKKVVPPITRDRMRRGEHALLQMCFDIPAGLQPEDLLPVAYWQHVAVHLQRAVQEAHCVLHCFAEDRTWYAQYLVLDAERNWAKVALLPNTVERFDNFKRSSHFGLLPGHTVDHGGSFAKWRVVRDADQQVLKDKLNTEGDAYAWLSEYGKSISH